MSDQPGTSAAASMEVVVEPPTKERDDEIIKIMQVLNLIIELSGKTSCDAINKMLNEGIVDVDNSDELSGVLMTVFTCLRKEEHDKPGHERYKGYVAKVLGAEIPVSTIVEKVKQKGINLDFRIATPIVEIMTLFRGFFDEVRTGVNKFNVRQSVAKKTMKRDAKGRPVSGAQEGKLPPQNISQYGLVNHHVPLLQGITLAPERRTGVIRSLGPMTQCILLVLEDRFHNKLKSAVLNSLQMLPMATEISNVLQNASEPSQVAGILKELADILIMTTARTTQKMYLPLTLIALMWNKRANYNIQWSFCGSGMLKYYTDFTQNEKIRFRIRSNGGVQKTAQCVFHACFGTYLEDLQILETITTHSGKWLNRKDMNEVFVKRGSAKPIDFEPIVFKYVSKMSQALLTKSLGNVDPTATSRPSFAGFRKRNFTAEFLSYLQTGKSGSKDQIMYALFVCADRQNNAANAWSQS